MRTRLRGPGGASTVTFPDDATISDLITQIIEKTAISKFDVKYGYPPKPLLLEQYEKSESLSKLDIKLDGEQLTISPRDDPALTREPRVATAASKEAAKNAGPGFSKKSANKPIGLSKKPMLEDVPELPLPSRGATLVLPGDDQSMPELRALVASAIQAEPEVYTKVVLEQKPDDYCRWIQTADAWGGAIEMGILSKHFEVEICSIDVQSLRIDKFNESAPTRCMLVYSGIHYDTIVQSPSDPPHTKADAPPDFDRRIWDGDDEEILIAAQDLCRKLQEKHYFTDTGGMAIKCGVCGVVVYGEGQASGHAQQTGHYDMAEVPT
ncbi:putative ubiquitin thioesterase otu1 [Amylocarpus encephaloides]|uniref:Ubiquitin thioesterase OTU n=1 Tax=Amylocarpus encephaloides TaxID=45428 RepID=A0A9P7YJI6_9HELO|nr:putative ubiquitin thioesterase otu1 [Amylocarpus encephaloides]